MPPEHDRPKCVLENWLTGSGIFSLEENLLLMKIVQICLFMGNTVLNNIHFDCIRTSYIRKNKNHLSLVLKKIKFACVVYSFTCSCRIHTDAMNNRRVKTSLTKYTSRFICKRFEKDYSKIACERELETEHKL